MRMLAGPMCRSLVAGFSHSLLVDVWGLYVVPETQVSALGPAKFGHEWLTLGMVYFFAAMA